MKNKLISKNPVQRFQWGQKIKKAAHTAVDILNPVVSGVGASTFNLVPGWQLLPFAAQYKVNNEPNRLDRHPRAKKLIRNAALTSLTGVAPVVASRMINDPSNAINEGAKRTANAAAGITGGGGVRGNNSTPNDATIITAPAIRNGRGNTPIYYATRAYRNNIPVDGLNSRDAVKKFQEETLRMTGSDLDGIWGDRTQAAYERWKNGQGSTPGGTPSVNPGMTPEQLLTGASVLSRNGTIPAPPSRDGRFSREYISQELFSRPIKTPTVEYDRSDIRQYLRDLGYDPYQFTGAQRRALRMVRNGVGTDSDKAIVKQMGIFKKGGQLISKNPIERFKVNFR